MHLPSAVPEARGETEVKQAEVRNPVFSTRVLVALVEKGLIRPKNLREFNKLTKPAK